MFPSPHAVGIFPHQKERASLCEKLSFLSRGRKDPNPTNQPQYSLVFIMIQTAVHTQGKKAQCNMTNATFTRNHKIAEQRRITVSAVSADGFSNFVADREIRMIAYGGVW